MTRANGDLGDLDFAAMARAMRPVIEATSRSMQKFSDAAARAARQINGWQQQHSAEHVAQRSKS